MSVIALVFSFDLNGCTGSGPPAYGDYAARKAFAIVRSFRRVDLPSPPCASPASLGCQRCMPRLRAMEGAIGVSGTMPPTTH
jgi:hypothetical protein